MSPLRSLWLVTPVTETAGGIFENHIFNGLGMEFVGSRFVISEPMVIDFHYTYAQRYI
jgi:hypothetical protein